MSFESPIVEAVLSLAHHALVRAGVLNAREVLDAVSDPAKAAVRAILRNGPVVEAESLSLKVVKGEAPD